MRALFDKLTTDQANTCGLVLSSAGILYRVKKGKNGWEVWVDEASYDLALASIKKYFEENEEASPFIEADEEPFQKTYTGIYVPLILFAWYITFLTDSHKGNTIHKYGASASEILHGEWYRLVTALMLHADGVHLAGNMAGIAIFGSAVCGIAGWGVGWLLILITGIMGNTLNALLIKTGHVSIGASTAIFGAVGILAGQQFFKLYRMPGKRMRAWLPLGGGLALLGFLGSGEHSDLTAHLFGFVSGLIIGIFYAFKVKRRPKASFQRYAMAAVFGILMIAWLTAFSHA